MPMMVRRSDDDDATEDDAEDVAEEEEEEEATVDGICDRRCRRYCPYRFACPFEFS